MAPTANASFEEREGDNDECGFLSCRGGTVPEHDERRGGRPPPGGGIRRDTLRLACSAFFNLQSTSPQQQPSPRFALIPSSTVSVLPNRQADVVVRWEDDLMYASNKVGSSAQNKTRAKKHRRNLSRGSWIYGNTCRFISMARGKHSCSFGYGQRRAK